MSTEPLAIVPPRTAEDRLLAAVVNVVDRVGFNALTVEQILNDACVSRATFYQYFSNAADCFWSGHRLHADRICERAAVAAADAEHPMRTVLDMLALEAVRSPAVARLVMSETVGAGPTGLLERDALIARLERLGDRAGGRDRIDLPRGILIGATFRFLAIGLDTPTLAKNAASALAEWFDVFRRGPTEPGWAERFTPGPPAIREHPTVTLAVNSRSRTARERIIRATATVIHERGFHALTVADIASAAGISRRRFYTEFPDKTAAFIGTYEYAFEQALAVCAPAFFSASSWPDRVWESAVAFTGFLAREPSLSYLGFAEGHAAGRVFSRRVTETHMAFTLFLEDGYRQEHAAASAPRASAELTAVTIAEIGSQAARASPGLFMRRIMPLAVYVALVPFIGPEQAGKFVKGKFNEVRRPLAVAAR
jgi:AcrR family transcriptional regulator